MIVFSADPNSVPGCRKKRLSTVGKSNLIFRQTKFWGLKVWKSVTQIERLQIMWGSSPVGPGARATQFLDDYYSGSQQNTTHGQQRFSNFLHSKWEGELLELELIFSRVGSAAPRRASLASAGRSISMQNISGPDLENHPSSFSNRFSNATNLGNKAQPLKPENVTSVFLQRKWWLLRFLHNT